MCHHRTVLTGLLALLLSSVTADAGELVNDTKRDIAVQQGTRDPDSGEFTWSEAVTVKAGETETIAEDHFYRHDTHVNDDKVTWSLPVSMAANDPQDYFFLFGNQVRIDVVRK